MVAAGLTPAGAANDGSAVTIVAPGANEILYGPTRIRVDAGGDAARVEIYLDRYSAPICTLIEPPYECEFDAGTRLDSRILRAVAFDTEGRRLGGDAIVTYSFVDPDTVVASTLTVPLVATGYGDSPPDLRDVEWDCLYGDEPCEVIGVGKLGDNVDGMARDGMMRKARDPMVEFPPVSLEVLIDVSPSVWADRIDIEDALRRIINEAPSPVEISLSEFAGRYRRLVPFTSSKSKLRRGLRELSDRQPWTCALGAVRRALSELQARAGHKALFLISDTQETCEATGIYPRQRQPQTESEVVNEEMLKHPEEREEWYAMPVRANRKAITRTLELSRQVGIPIYVYRVGGVAGMSVNAMEAFETMAEESGGRLLSAGDLSGLTEGVGALLSDLESTWMLDIALPDFAAMEHEAELSLEPRVSDPIGLRYPERWRGGNRESLLLTLLRLGDAEARGWAATQLRDSRDRTMLKELLGAYREESSAANRIEQMTAIYHVSAYLLLHGDEDDQRAALSTIEEIWEIDPILVRRLRPALRTFQSMDSPRKLRLKAERLAEPAPRTSRTRPDQQG
jgi:hypothetical protein